MWQPLATCVDAASNPCLRRWQKKEDKDSTEQLTSDVLGILNKITPEKFDVLFGKVALSQELLVVDC